MLLKQIPAGKVSTYAAMSKALNSSPRAVGGALRRNPFAPEVPCHRVISADGVGTARTIRPTDILTCPQYVGGFKGEWQKAPSGINTDKKLQLLKGEGVLFDDKGMLLDRSRLWAEFDV